MALPLGELDLGGNRGLKLIGGDRLTGQDYSQYVQTKLVKFVNTSFSVCFPPSRLKQHFYPLKTEQPPEFINLKFKLKLSFNYFFNYFIFAPLPPSASLPEELSLGTSLSAFKSLLKIHFYRMAFA